ncbi:rhodanese-like domain-containing protein [Alicyclobacillus tolerans]|uniref:Rhodanese-related sulfurtransferase n=2 Tax=Alicyclobacillus tolerans TaxID=90970 RepID=A0ABT9LS65_9BACL|nr:MULTISPECIES: rhodanese-like domain-containing protein [Alicyclobacillus]MDP9727105.1 rhodanese-related sulfurtransferase [Alicyclobacillus tengchongensis]QRF22877.1 rhodanese-like domain-containing protein [Alicyclobacillus sp. TC]SHK74908.1 Rhodanese-related sulfurtransferase [Alicyclobacillus montanus]
MTQQVQNILPLDVQQRLKNGEKLQIIDVREPSEVATGKIPGAKNIPLSQLPHRLNEIDQRKEAIMVCRSGGRSMQACQFLIGQGYQVKNMMGGMLGWNWDVE